WMKSKRLSRRTMTKQPNSSTSQMQSNSASQRKSGINCNKAIWKRGCYIVFCKNCGAENPSGTTFCNSCGATLSEMKYCQHCGAQIDKACVICPRCGKQVSSLGAAPAAP